MSSAVGGNLAGGLLKKLSLGTLWNSVVGILGGGLGEQILSWLGLLASAQGGGMDVGSIIGNVASSGVGGAVLLVIVGWVKSMMGKK